MIVAVANDSVLDPAVVVKPSAPLELLLDWPETNCVKQRSARVQVRYLIFALLI